MATTTSKRRRNKAKQRNKKSNNQMVTIGAAVFTLALLAFGLFQFYTNSQTTSNSALIPAESGSLESVSIDGDHSTASEPVAATDRETRFLGPASDAASVALAEAGQLGQPTLLWFHADW